MKKCYLAALLCGIAFCTLTACDSSYTEVAVDAEDTTDKNANPFRELTCVPNNNIEKKIVYDYTDPETGVHYLIYSEHQYSSGMGGITPRLNPDGSVMVDKK